MVLLNKTNGSEGLPTCNAKRFAKYIPHQTYPRQRCLRRIHPEMVRQ